MKALTFLGTGAYKAVTYVWQGEGGTEYTARTHLFPEAIAHIFRPDQLLVFVTERAKQSRPPGETKTHLEALQERLCSLDPPIDVEPIDIPEGRSEAELWKIFDCIATAVPEGETILLDITHAFRSIPVLVLAIAAYLRRTKRVTIRHILYGAFEAREPFREPPQPEDQAPIFDLTLLLDLLDWLSGAEALLERADGRLLAQRLKEVHRQQWRQGGEELPRKLQTLGDRLNKFSLSLWLNRPREGMRKAHELVDLLNEAEPEVTRWAKPFGVILEQIRKAVEPIAYENLCVLDQESLAKQHALIGYCLEKGLIVQAVTLAREWLINWVMLHRGEGNWLERGDREEVERALGAAMKRQRDEPAEVPEWLDLFPRKDAVIDAWGRLGQLRNDLAHCGMTRDAALSQSVEQRVNELSKLLESLSAENQGGRLVGGQVVIDLKNLYGEVAKLDELSDYLEQAGALAGEGNDVMLTGQAPIWLYLAVAHALHGKARRLWYTSPVTGEVLIFDHSAR